MQNSRVTEKELEKMISDCHAEGQCTAKEAAAAFPSQMIDA
jgi:hypothetical protein